MKKCKKKIIPVIIICLVLTSVLDYNIFAATTYAYSIGTNYSTLLDPDIDTSEDATYAASVFGMIGYKSYYNIKPTSNYMKGNAPNGTRRLGCEVVFLSGHGNSQLMSFNYKSKDGNYATGIIQGDDYQSDKGYTYAGVNDCDMSKTKLFVLAGCKTAYGSDNITRDVVNEGGASTAIGWIKSVNASDHSKWLKRFCDKLSEGVTVIEATKYANSFSYSDYNVKTTWVHGNLKTKICSSNYALKKTKTDERMIHVKDTIKISKRTKSAQIKKLLLKAIDNSNTKIDIDKFVVKRNGKIIDLVYTVNGCETQNGYTIFLEDNQVKEIYNNMPEDVNLLKINSEKIIKPYISKKYREKCFSLAEKKIDSDYTVISQNGKVVYDTYDNTYKYYVLTDYKSNADGGLGRYGNYYEIY